MPRNNAADKPRAVVLVRFSALGDVAMTIPAVYDLCAARPDLRVVLVTRVWMAKMAVNAPANLTVVGADLGERHKGPRGMSRLVADLRRDYDIEAFIDLHDVLRTRLMRVLFRLHGVPVTKIDKGRSDKNALVATGAKAFGRTLTTTIDRYRSAIAGAGYPVPERFKSLFPAHASNSTFRVGIAPFAAHPGKVYPLDRMKEVVTALAERPGTEIYVFGAGDAEADAIDGLADSHSNVVNMARRREGLAKELELMSRLDVMVAMDSGNMHLASIARTPRVISIWGATHPASGFAPFHAHAADILGADLPCRPCSVYGNAPCRFGDLRCMAAITPDAILSAILSTLPDNNSAPGTLG